MAIKNKFDLHKNVLELERVKKDLPILIANRVKRLFTDSFQKQGWDGKPWKPKQYNPNNKSTLVRTGNLRRAVNNSIRKATWNAIVFGVGLPYAQIHNEGGEIRQGARDHVLHFKQYKDDNGKSRAKFSKSKKATMAQKVNIGAHTITMPKRQFMGHSREVDKIVTSEIQKAMKKVFKK